MKDKSTQMWIPLYVDKWIFGSTRIELEPAERSVFVDLLAFGAKDQGYIRANETTAYHHTQLAGLLNIPIELLQSTITKCLHFEKLVETTPGIYRLKNWEVYQLSDDYKYRLETGRKVIPGSAVRENSDCSPKNPDYGPTKPGPIREEKIREEKRVEDKKPRAAFAPPTIQEVQDYCRERGNTVNPCKWLSHYEANGWKVGKNPMKDWKASVRTWEHSEYNQNANTAQKRPIVAPSNAYDQDKEDAAAVYFKRSESWHKDYYKSGSCHACGYKVKNDLDICNCETYKKLLEKAKESFKKGGE